MHAHSRRQQQQKKNICRAGASYRQLWVTACAQGCRKRGRGEGGTLRFPDFSQPSPLSGFHCTADSERRRRHAPCVPQSRIRFAQLASSQSRTDPRRGEYNNTERVCGHGGIFFSLSHPHMIGRTTESPATIRRRQLASPGRARKRCVSQTETEASLSAWLLRLGDT